MEKLNTDIDSDSEVVAIDNQAPPTDVNMVELDVKQRISFPSASQSSILEDAMYEIL